MAGKRGLVMGVANDHSIAWGIAAQAAAAGAELAFTYQNETVARRVVPLAEQLGSSVTLACDVGDAGQTAAVFDTLGQTWGQLDFVIHALAFADKAELRGPYLETSRANFTQAMLISCFSFTEVARHAAPLMTAGGALLTLTYLGAMRHTPNYNVMGVAKAGLEASVRYLAVDLGGRGIRVNALSAGPVKTLAGAAISGARHVFRHSAENAPLGRNPDRDEVGRAGLYLVSPLSSGVTGEVHFVDGGYHHIGVPQE